MSEFENEGGGLEGMINQRSENSVLFSLDSLSAAGEADSDSSEEFAFGGSGDESGLIDLNTLARIGASSAETSGDPDAMPALFNATPKRKSSVGIIVALVVLVLLIAGGLTYYFMVMKPAAEEKALAAETEKSKAEQERRKVEEELRKQLAQAEAEKVALENKSKAELSDEQMKKILAEEMAANNEANSGSKSKRSGGSGSSSKSDGDSGDAAAAAAPKPSGGGKPNPEAVKNALIESSKKAQKCGKGGSLNVQFTLNPNGKASNVQALGGSFKGTATERCIITVVEKNDFPKYNGAPVKGVKYTYKLQ